MSRSLLLRRLTSFIRVEMEQNRRLLTSTADELAPYIHSDVYMTDNCVRRLKELNAEDESVKGKMLRLSVESGGCSGFQYAFLLDEKKNKDDRIFEKDGVKLVVDDITFDFVKGATIDYVDELIRSAFQVKYRKPKSLLSYLSQGYFPLAIPTLRKIDDDAWDQQQRSTSAEEMQTIDDDK